MSGRGEPRPPLLKSRRRNLQELQSIRIGYSAPDPVVGVEEHVRLRAVRVSQNADHRLLDNVVPGHVAEDDWNGIGANVGDIFAEDDLVAQEARLQARSEGV